MRLNQKLTNVQSASKRKKISQKFIFRKVFDEPQQEKRLRSHLTLICNCTKFSLSSNTYTKSVGDSQIWPMRGTKHSPVETLITIFPINAITHSFFCLRSLVLPETFTQNCSLAPGI